MCKGTLTLDSLETVSTMASKKCRPKVVISLIRKISWQTAFRWFEPEFQTSAHSKWIRINEFFVWFKCKSWRRVHLPFVYLIEWSLKGKPIIAKLQASIGCPSFYTVGNQLFALHHCVENNRKKNFPALFPNLFLWSCVSCTFLIFFLSPIIRCSNSILLPWFACGLQFRIFNWYGHEWRSSMVGAITQLVVPRWLMFSRYIPTYNCIKGYTE